MNPDAWCPTCERATSSDHDSSLCNDCGRMFCETLGDVMLGLCQDCIKKLADRQSA